MKAKRLRSRLTTAKEPFTKRLFTDIIGIARKPPSGTSQHCFLGLSRLPGRHNNTTRSKWGRRRASFRDRATISCTCCERLPGENTSWNRRIIIIIIVWNWTNIGASRRSGFHVLVVSAASYQCRRGLYRKQYIAPNPEYLLNVFVHSNPRRQTVSCPRK